METREIVSLPEDSGIDDRGSGIFRMLRNPLENPLLFLFLVFFSYLVVDAIATLIMAGKIEEWYIPLIHFLAGYMLIAVYFSKVLPDFFQRKRRVFAVFSLLFLLAVSAGLKLFAFYLILGSSGFSKAFLVTEFLRVFHFLAITSAIWILYENLGLRKNKHEIEMTHERLKVEHRSMQLSPHFVLNVLSLYAARIVKLSPELFKEFSRLASLLRYSFKEFGLPNTLREELNGVMDYLEIQKLRFPDLSMELTVQVDKELAGGLTMPKMCLLTLVENVFFHGDYRDRENPCRMEFVLSPNAASEGYRFRVFISNRIQKQEIKVRSGFGASAVFRVMGYEFGERFHATVEPGDSIYSLVMTIDYDTSIQGWAN